VSERLVHHRVRANLCSRLALVTTVVLDSILLNQGILCAL